MTILGPRPGMTEANQLRDNGAENLGSLGQARN